MTRPISVEFYLAFQAGATRRRLRPTPMQVACALFAIGFALSVTSAARVMASPHDKIEAHACIR